MTRFRMLLTFSAVVPRLSQKAHVYHLSKFERYSTFLDLRSDEAEGNVQLGSGAASLGDCPMKEGLRLSFLRRQVPYSSTPSFCILPGSYEAFGSKLPYLQVSGTADGSSLRSGFELDIC